MSIEVYYINAFSERTVTYDRNGNILSLTRYGADTAVPEEALAYSYDGNMLVGVSNSGSSGGGGTYAHDANGNLTRDGLSGLDIGYDDLNLTSRISSGDTTLAEYGHLADGTKINSADGSGNGLQYRGSLVYTQTAGQSGSPTLTLDCALTSAGRIVRETTDDGSVSYRPLIHLRDHLGSVRAVIDGDTGTVLEANDYYPFGKRIPTVTEALSVTEPVEVTSNPNPHSVASTSSTTAPTSPNRWLFSGKESQSFLSAAIPLLDFGARMYDPLTARWTAQDPLAEKYYAVSPYAYCEGMPVNLIDRLGKEVIPYGDAELEMIRNTLPEEARKYVQLDKNGMINKELLAQYACESLNFKNLINLVNSDKVIKVSFNDNFSFKDKDGQLGTADMSYFPFDESFPEDKDTDFVFISGLSTGESGFYGKTLFPDNDGDQNSTTDAIEIIIHPSLSKVGAAEAFSHEGYGHALLYIRNGGNHNAASHITKGMTETNIVLKSMILKARKETFNNITK